MKSKIVIYLFFLSILTACYSTQKTAEPDSVQTTDSNVYSHDEIIQAVSGFFDTTSENAGIALENIFKKYGQPVGYITGKEGAIAFGIGLRYGNGHLWMKNGQKERVYWQGPSLGWDFGGNAVKVFTLVYNMHSPEQIYRRFPGVEGSAYLIAGLGVNFQRAENIVLAPIRSGIGLRLGANVGYISYSRKQHILPF